MALINGEDVALWLALDSTYGADYEEVAAVASAWINLWCTIPEDTTVIVLAAKMLAARLAKRSTTPEGIGGLSGEGSVFYVARTDPDLKLLLEPFFNYAGMI